MSSPDPLRQTLLPHAATMLEVASRSIRAGLVDGRPLDLSGSRFDPLLGTPGACFVSLHLLDDSLRGCIGSWEPKRPLIFDIARNAYLAAFEDPRFPPLRAAEFPRLKLEVSVLGTPDAVLFDSDSALLGALEPGRDGLIIEQHRRRALFLPQVWETLPEPSDFLAHLKDKAGLPRGPLGPGAQAWRFSVVNFSTAMAAIVTGMQQ